MNIIIVGCGKAGYAIARELSAKDGVDVTVVDSNSEIFDEISESIDAIFLEGNGASERTLIEAGAKAADLIIATTTADELNVLCCIMAEHLGTKHSVARVRNPEYMIEYNKLWAELGIDFTLNPERLTAGEISGILQHPADAEAISHKPQAVMIIGGGRITYYLVELLSKHAEKTEIKIIEKDRAKCERLYDALKQADCMRNCLIINGDGTSEELLTSEDVDKMDAIVCLTGRDEENAIISLYALGRGVNKVITKISHIQQDMIKSLGLGHIITPHDLSARVLGSYVDGIKGASQHEL